MGVRRQKELGGHRSAPSKGSGPLGLGQFSNEAEGDSSRLRRDLKQQSGLMRQEVIPPPRENQRLGSRVRPVATLGGLLSPTLMGTAKSTPNPTCWWSSPTPSTVRTGSVLSRVGLPSKLLGDSGRRGNNCLGCKFTMEFQKPATCYFNFSLSLGKPGWKY